MALTTAEIDDVLSRAWPTWAAERLRTDRIDAYLRGRHDGPYQPKEAGTEYRRLSKRAQANMLPLVVDVKAQNLYVEGYRGGPGAGERSSDEQRWRIWQDNGMDRRQSALHRGALSFGFSYAVALPGDPSPVLRGVSARRMVTLYSDPLADEWPEFAVQVDPRDERSWSVTLYDEDSRHSFPVDREGRRVAGQPVVVQTHGAGVCPVVRFADSLDLEGRSRGQVEPLLDLQDRLDQTLFDLLMTQQFASWKVRTVSGIALPDAEAEAYAQKLRLSQDRLLLAEDPDTKFGDLGETPLGGFIDAVELAVRQIATVSQTPPHYLLGQMSNLSAEALAAAEAGLSRNVTELKHTFGESWEQLLQLAGSYVGAPEESGTERAQVVWRDTESRSLSQVADALGKLAQMLGVPVELLWEKIPGWTSQDVERAKALRDSDPFTLLADAVNAQTAPAASVAPPPAAAAPTVVVP